MIQDLKPLKWRRAYCFQKIPHIVGALSQDLCKIPQRSKVDFTLLTMASPTRAMLRQEQSYEFAQSRSSSIMKVIHSVLSVLKRATVAQVLEDQRRIFTSRIKAASEYTKKNELKLFLGKRPPMSPSAVPRHSRVCTSQVFKRMSSLHQSYKLFALAASQKPTRTPFAGDITISLLKTISPSFQYLSIFSNFCSILTTVYPISVNANCCPIQIRGPPLKGRYVHGLGVQ